MRTSVFFLFVIFLSACSISPKEISYGSDICDFCKMTIVDKQHSAQLVTTKGKPYLFDAIECLVPFINENPEKEAGLLLVADYKNLGNLIDAKSAYYLISPSIPSPMGAYLSAFNSKVAATSMKESNGGKIFTFEELEQGLKEK